MPFPIEQQVKITFTFKDATSALVDPANVSVDIKDPDGVETTNTSPVHDSLGVYHVLLNLDKPGHYWVKGRGDGPSTLHIATPWTLVATEADR